MKVSEEKKVFAVFSNTDLTEGRGAHFAKFLCRTIETARRLAKGAYVMGTNCPIEEISVYRLDNHYWYGPVKLVEESKEDIELRKRREEKETRQKEKSELIDKFRACGVSDEDIANLLKLERSI